MSFFFYLLNNFRTYNKSIISKLALQLFDEKNKSYGRDTQLSTIFLLLYNVFYSFFKNNILLWSWKIEFYLLYYSIKT